MLILIVMPKKQSGGRTRLSYLTASLNFSMHRFLIIIAWALFLSGSAIAQVSIEFPTQFIVRDEGLSKLSYIDTKQIQPVWQVDVPVGRDMQLIGRALVMIGTGNGYEERELSTGKRVREVKQFPGTIAARMLRNGNVILTGVNWQEKQGIVLVEISLEGTIVELINYPQFNYVRLARETPDNTFLLTADDVVFEGDRTGKIIWQAKLEGREKPHAWQAVRISNGQTLVSGGYTGDLQFYSKEGKYLRSMKAAADSNARFYSGFEIMANSKILVANWLGHGPGNGSKGQHLVEFDLDGVEHQGWRFLPERFSSVQGVIVLDNADVRYLHVENEFGKLVPVK
jgi:hypothetical protein